MGNEKMRFHLTLASRNKKTGPIPVATSSKDSCPSACPLKDGGGCYAETGPLALHWRKLSNMASGLDFEDFLRAVRMLPNGIWRYGQAGDLPGRDNVIDRGQMLELARANRGRPVIAFTHKPLTEENVETLKEAEKLGFHVNVSADDPAEADELLKSGLSTVTVLSSEYGRKKNESLSHYRHRLLQMPLTTPEGRRIAICPATYANTTCQRCRACSHRRSLETVIGFPAHGSKARTVDSQLADRMTNGPQHSNGPTTT